MGGNAIDPAGMQRSPLCPIETPDRPCTLTQRRNCIATPALSPERAVALPSSAFSLAPLKRGPGMFQGHSGNPPMIFRERSEDVLGTLRVYSGKAPRKIFRKPHAE
eukprot:473999-Pleurochrysis_carterae.AAC.2